MSKLTTFHFNGQEYSTFQSITLSDLINYFDYKSILFVLEYNNYICNKTEWCNVNIEENDKIEIITIVGGG
jgi:sulfur carrier protein